GQHPDRGALVDGQRSHLGRDGGDELQRRGAGADDRDPLAGQLHLVVPGHGVDGGAGEVVKPGDGRVLRGGEPAVGADQVAGGDCGAVGQLDGPVVGVLVEPGGCDLGVEPDTGP